MRILIILTLIFGINSCTAQSESESEKKLIGKWILVAETDSWDDENIEPLGENNSESDSVPDSKTELKTYLTFNIDKTIFINQMGNEYNATYKLTDSLLTIGNRNYILLEIDKEKLFYKDKNGLLDRHYEFKKVE
jgi:heat shock protein HslJ